MTIVDEDLKSNKKPFLQAKFQIGSCKGPINFRATGHVFHADDVPTLKRENKKKVLKYKKSKILSKLQDWNISNQMPELFPKKRFRTNFEHDRPNMYQYNLRAEVFPHKNLQPISKPHKFKVIAMTQREKDEINKLKEEDPVLAGQAKRTQEMPINPKLFGSKKWNQSTVLTATELRRRIANTDSRASLNSSKKSEKISSKYTSLESKYKQDLEQRRYDKANKQEVFEVKEFKNEKLSGQYHNRLAKEPSRKYKTFKHSGVWEYNKLEGEWMWSDTGSFIKDSLGDIVQVHNPCALNFSSPNCD